MHNKTILCLLTTLLSVSNNSVAQSEDLTEPTQTQTQENASCVQAIDDKAIEQFSQHIDAFETEMAALCKAGQLEEARNTAIRFVHQVSTDATAQALIGCGQSINDWLGHELNTDKDQLSGKSRSVCADYKEPIKRSRQWTVWP